MSHEKRQASTSITHLVKTVAGEVFDERTQRAHDEHNRAHCEIQGAIKSLSRRVNHLQYCLSDEIPPIDDCPEDWGKPNAGGFWSDHEEEALIRDLRKAVKWMAAQRGRTVGSIDARLALLSKRGRIW